MKSDRQLVVRVALMLSVQIIGVLMFFAGALLEMAAATVAGWIFVFFGVVLTVYPFLELFSEYRARLSKESSSDAALKEENK